MTRVVVGLFAAIVIRSNIENGTKRIATAVAEQHGQVIVGIFSRLSKRWTKNQRGSVSGTNVRAMSLVFVKR